jgi:hypothetical protein
VPHHRVKVITVDVTLPFDLMAIEEEQPVLTLVTAAFFMAMSLIFPAVVDAAQRGCLSVGGFLVDHPVARFGDGWKSPLDPWVQESMGERPWQPWS